MEPTIQWGMDARPFYGCQITWYLTHNDRVLVWKGGEELINHQQVIIEGDDAVELSDGTTRPSRSYSEWSEMVCFKPRYDKASLGDAIVAAAKFFGLHQVLLAVDTKQADHIVVSLSEAT